MTGNPTMSSKPTSSARSTGRADFQLLVKPTGAICNLDCKYCFFLSKEQLYPGSRFRMADDLLDLYLRQLLESQFSAEVNVAWQGGEPTLMGLDFFRRATELAERYRKPGQKLVYTIQTNGTRLDDEWAAFFKAHGYLVGLSVDGPADLHDAYRVDKGGRGTFECVRAGWEVLRRHGVDVNILCTVHRANADRPLDVYRFFRDDLKAQFLQFIPIVERVTAATHPMPSPGGGAGTSDRRPTYLLEGSEVTDRSVTPDQWGQFLMAIFDEWVRHDVGQMFVQMFDAALASWLGVPPALCIFNETCGAALALEHNGDLYACDHYVEPAYKLGNIEQVHMLELVISDQQRRFGLAKRDTLPHYCRECAVRFACHGECPKNRFINTPAGEPGLNYLCAGYKPFFTHIDRPMRMMADLIRRGQYADEVMSRLAADSGSASRTAGS